MAPPRAWAWVFGDTGTSTQQNPTHTYGGSGPTTVTNASGSDMTTKPVTVN